jgi:hypothetical protein
VRAQLRPFYTPEQRAVLYGSTYRHEKWEDHRHRVAHTAGVLAGMEPASVADLSCGDGAVVAQAKLTCRVVLGDITPGWDVAGPVEETIALIKPVDVFVCSETLEHVQDPDGLLRAIRAVAKRLLLTTPDGETGSENPEHYWGWNRDDLAPMMEAAGWAPEVPAEQYVPPVPNPYYAFQVWRCRWA